MSAAAAASMPPAGSRPWWPVRVDPLGALLAAAGLAALLFLPFVVFKSNRIVPGDPRSLTQALPLWSSLACQAALLLAAVAALGVANARVRLATAGLAVVAVALAAAAAGDTLTPPGNRVVRIAPGGAFWVLLIALGLMATDAVTRMRPGPAVRVLFLVSSLAVAGFALAHGTFDHLSVMREYAVNAARFAREARQHVVLALGSLGAAAVVGLPVGILCHRVPRLRPGILGTLNVIQTIPAIALFGILMAPLGALAAAVPLADRLGIRGIGAAPAVVALFLYSLLPIVANTVAGLTRVSRAAVDAAHGVGMTPRQVLTGVELPLALPVILTGIRVVLVQNIGMVTVAALIGGGGLGAFVFQGIGQTAIDLVLLGAIPIVVLAFSAAVLLDALVEVLDRGAAMISVEALTKVYGAATVVDGVSFTVERNSITVIVGTSGSGKSTLLRMINRLIEPTSGRVLLDGKDTRSEPAYLLRRRIGYVIQGHGLFPHRTVAENIATVPRLLGWEPARIRARVTELLEVFQLDPATYAGAFPHQLSGGQQQRVGVARALAAGPAVLLMDEPFGALDPIIRAKAQDDLLDVRRSFGTTVVLVTHDMDEAFRLGDRVAVMSQGRLLQYDRPAVLLTQPADPFVSRMTGIADRSMRLLSLISAGDAASAGVSDGPTVAASATLRDVLCELVWKGAQSAAVVDADGTARGRLTVAAILAFGRP